MKSSLTKKEMKDYQQFCLDRLYGRILTVDGLLLICKANDYDPEKIGKHFIEMANKFETEKR